MDQVVVAVPVKPFAAAKRRLGECLSQEVRGELGRELARRTLGVAVAAGGHPLLLAADPEVAELGAELGIAVLLDRGSSLDAAADGAVVWARSHRAGWLICHADLPLLTPVELGRAIQIVAGGGLVLAASSDGGTSLIGGVLEHFAFGYGRGSFHRHLSRAASHDPAILTGTGLQLDLDHPADLEAAAAKAGWLAQMVRPVDTLFP